MYMYLRFSSLTSSMAKQIGTSYLDAMLRNKSPWKTKPFAMRREPVCDDLKYVGLVLCLSTSRPEVMSASKD